MFFRVFIVTFLIIACFCYIYGQVIDSKNENVFKDKLLYRKQSFYERCIKRLMDIFCALIAIIFFWWIYLIIAVLVKIKLGSPVIFKQKRPGKNEKIFTLYKFRTMTEKRDENGVLLPDEQRLTKFGKWLRSTSLDELPEVFNILNGTLSCVGPRPQLVRDIVFMSDNQRMRHIVRPGLSGLAQVNGRNDIDWDEKLDWDLKYVDKVTFLGDARIIFQTVIKAFIKREGITMGNMATAEDFGDWLLDNGRISKEDYDAGQAEARGLLESR